MRAVLVVLAVACGCTQAQTRHAHRAGEIATAGGLIGMLVSASSASLIPSQEDTLAKVGLAFIPITVIGALIFISTDESSNPVTAPPPSRRERQRAAAWELTKQAKDAARARDCTQ